MSFIFPAGTVYVDISLFVEVMLLKVPWFTPGFSYCRWWGVECCLTASEASLPACTQGLQSIGALTLAGQSHWALDKPDLLQAHHVYHCLRLHHQIVC